MYSFHQGTLDRVARSLGYAGWDEAVTVVAERLGYGDEIGDFFCDAADNGLELELLTSDDHVICLLASESE